MSFFRFTWLRLIAAILILLFTAFALLVGTQSGSRWLLNTVMAQINGRMLQIEGTIWSGIESKELEDVYKRQAPNKPGDLHRCLKNRVDRAQWADTWLKPFSQKLNPTHRNLN